MQLRYEIINELIEDGVQENEIDFSIVEKMVNDIVDKKWEKFES